MQVMQSEAKHLDCIATQNRCNDSDYYHTRDASLRSA